jgi:tRNA A37 threonylcarbamoyladenosine biosynthesis protein TsaE
MNLNEVVNKILNVINNKDRIIFFINGPMGVGKTRLSRTIVNQLNGNFPNSASYSLINVINGTKRILHGDFYRQCLDSEILDCELLPYLSNDFLLLLEWCEPFKIVNGVPHYSVTISFTDQGYRSYSICSLD